MAYALAVGLTHATNLNRHVYEKTCSSKIFEEQNTRRTETHQPFSLVFLTGSRKVRTCQLSVAWRMMSGFYASSRL